MDVVLGAARLGTPRQVLPDAWLEIRGDRVAAVGPGKPPGQPDMELDGALVVPGFVDLHCHGGGGGTYGEGGDAAATAAAFHRAHGTTTTLASLVSASPSDLLRQVKELADVARGGVVAGIHLEGPWLSELRCGAHDPTVLRDPSQAELAELVDVAVGTLVMVTLAPERTNAIDIIGKVAGSGMLAAVGHTNATFEATVAAIDAGARVATHLGNAMRPMHQREPGPFVALLDDPRVTCEVINDGMHVHPAVVGHILRSAGAPRTALVTDAIAAAGLDDGPYRVGPVAVFVVDGLPRVEGTDVLAGSTLTLEVAFRRAVQACGFSIPDAVAATSTTPASLLGRTDLGDLRAGARADLVVMDDGLSVAAVMAGGEWAGPPFS